MSVIYIALPLAIILAGLGLWAFVWSVRQGQYDDLDTPAMRILHTDDDPDVISADSSKGRGTARRV